MPRRRFHKKLKSIKKTINAKPLLIKSIDINIKKITLIKEMGNDKYKNFKDNMGTLISYVMSPVQNQRQIIYADSDYLNKVPGV